MRSEEGGPPRRGDGGGDDGGEEFPGGSRIPAPIRRNAPLIVGILVVLAAGPAISRLLDAYRAVVLAQEDSGTLVAFEARPPKVVSKVEAQLGDILVKERLEWSPRVVPAEATDLKLVEMHRRYNSSYEGVILRLDPPRAPGGAYVAIVQTQGGEKLSVPLYGEQLAPAREGQRLRKLPGSWEPVLISEFMLLPGAAALAPAPGAAPPAAPPGAPGGGTEPAAPTAAPPAAGGSGPAAAPGAPAPAAPPAQ